MAWLRRGQVSSKPDVYIRKISAMNVPFQFQTAQMKADESALLDSGATENFIDEETWKRLQIGRNELKEKSILHNVDGMKNKKGELTHFCWLRIKYHKQEALMKFYITSLGKDRLILGYPFLEMFNPKINWTKGEMKEGHLTLESAAFKHLNKYMIRTIQRGINKVGKPKEGEAIYLKKASIAQKMAHKFSKEPVVMGLPEEFQEYAEVFSEERAKHFPPPQGEDGDFPIKLRPEVPREMNCKVYPLTREELKTLKQYLAKQLEKRYIEPGGSNYTSPVFFIGKKDSQEKRLVVDYQKLNHWTITDNGPLPNIQTLVANLQGKELFTKFDIRWGYNNVRIKRKDRHKAAFKTPMGTYIPNVAQFGLKNMPAWFQRLMWRDVGKVLAEYADILFNYLDDWIIASPAKTKEDVRRHIQCAKALLKVFRQKSYFLKLSKSHFLQKRIDFLGWIVEAGTIKPDPAKVQGLKEWPRELHSVAEV